MQLEEALLSTYIHTITWRAFRKQQKHASLHMFSGFCLICPQATEVLKPSPGLQLDTPAGLLPGSRLIILSLHYQEIQFSPVKKKQKNPTTIKKKTLAEGNMSSHYKDKAE